jgi:RNA polymerase sigma-70 factor (family 1)
MLADRDEQYIKERCSNGDRDAFTWLYSWYYKPLYRHIFLFLRSKETTEEIIQNLFVKVWENRETLHTVRDLKPYLYRMAKNMLLNHLRNISTERRVLQMRSSTESSTEDTVADHIDSKDYRKLLQEAISQLTDKRKEIFLLRVEENLSLDEIAGKLSISKNVVKKQLYAAIASIREYIHRQGGLTTGLLMLLVKII